MRVTDTLVLLYPAEITTEVWLETCRVVTLKFTDVAPAGTVILAGTIATFVLLLERLIAAPPEGAGPLSVTVPVEVDPPLILAGLSVSVKSVGSGIEGGVKVTVGIKAGVSVTVAVVVAMAVGVNVGGGDPAPIHNSALTFELL